MKAIKNDEIKDLIRLYLKRNGKMIKVLKKDEDGYIVDYAEMCEGNLEFFFRNYIREKQAMLLDFDVGNSIIICIRVFVKNKMGEPDYYAVVSDVYKKRPSE